MAFPNRVTTNGDIIFGGESPTFMAPPNQGFSTGGNTRYFPCIDQFALVIRMNKSVDAGVNWTEEDAANVPVVPADGAGGTGFVEVYQFIGAAIDPASKIVYTVYFDPASFNVALAPFDTKTDKWLPSIISTLSYLPTAANQFFNLGSFVLNFRPNDRSVWFWFYGGGADANDVATVWGAKCVVTAAGTGTWDLALTRIAGTLHDGIEWAQGGSGVDPVTGDIHYWALRHYSGFGATAHTTQHPDGLGNMVVDGVVLDLPGAGYLASTTLPFTVHVSGLPDFHSTATVLVDGGGVTSFVVPVGLIGATYLAVSPDPTASFGTSGNNSDLMHYVLKPDNSIVGPQFVGHDSFQITFSSAIRFGSNGTMISTYIAGPNINGVRRVVRALVGDAPVWETLTPAPMQTNTFDALTAALHRDIDGLDYVFFAFSVAGVGEQYFYMASKGIGQAFGAAVLIGTVPLSDPNDAANSIVAMLFNPIAITFAYGDGIHFGAIGMGWFELSLPEPAPVLTLTFKGQKVYPR